MGKRKKSLPYFIRLAVTAIIMVTLIHVVGWHDIFQSLSRVNIFIMAIAWFIAIIGRFAESAQMSRIMKEASMNISVHRVFLAKSLSGLLSLTVPGDLASGVAKWANMSAAVGKKSGVLNAMVYDRLMLLFPWLLAGLVSIAILNPTRHPILPIIAFSFTVFAIVFSILFYHPYTGMIINDFIRHIATKFLPKILSKKIEYLLSSLIQFYGFPLFFHLYMFSRSVLIMCLGLLGFVIAGMAVGISLPITVLIWAKSVITLLRQLPITLGGLGIREAVLLTVFSPFAVPDSDAFTLGMLMFSNVVIFALIGLAYQICLSLGIAQWHRSGEEPELI